MRTGQNKEALDYINNNLPLFKSTPSIAEYFAAFLTDLSDGLVSIVSKHYVHATLKADYTFFLS